MLLGRHLVVLARSYRPTDLQPYEKAAEASLIDLPVGALI